MKVKNRKEVTNHKTGEITTTEITYAIKAKNSEEFFTTYFSFMKHMLKIKSALDLQVLAKFCMMLQFNSNRVMLTTGARKEMCTEFGVLNTNLSASIKRLKALGMMTGEDGDYEINPKIFWKGTSDERNNLLRTKGIELRIQFSAAEE